jgi:hypothetical protein
MNQTQTQDRPIAIEVITDRLIDRSFLVTAMSHADKAVNFLLGIKPEPYKPTKKATK